jgi:hypothetical protein
MSVDLSNLPPNQALRLRAVELHLEMVKASDGRYLPEFSTAESIVQYVVNGAKVHA